MVYASPWPARERPFKHGDLDAGIGLQGIAGRFKVLVMFRPHCARFCFYPFFSMSPSRLETVFPALAFPLPVNVSVASYLSGE